MIKTKCPSVTSLGSDGNTSFLRAARAGHLDKVLEHLQSNIDINTSNANGLNALHLASKDGHVHVVTELLKRGAVVDSATKKGNTALHIASLAGQEEVVKLLVQHGASVNVQSQNGFTPLYMAAQENHDSVVKYLLANGANQSLATEDGFTPLAVAMQQGHDKVVAVLLENDTRGKVRLPALHIAAKKDDVKAAKLLLENEHNPDVTSKSGFTPLHIASHYGNESIANLLVQKGADVNYAAKHNISPLHVAAKWGKTNMVALLLEKSANIESKTRDGLTPLHCAARSGHEQVVDMLLERGAPISSKTKNGLAPLHMAAQGDHVDAARILLYHRAPVDEVTVDYLTALHVAAHCGHARVAKLLLDRQADANARALNGFTPLHIACKKNRIKVVELLLKHGASIGATTESGLTPLHVASFMGCMNIVIYLLQHEANPDVPTVRGETPLHLAARANQTDIIRILLRNGAQVDARAREQQTPLHIASRLGNVDIVMLLLQHGAQVDTTTKDMYTALHIAAKEGQDEVAGVLLENGASLNATTKKGFTPLHLAAKYGNMKVAKLLLQREAPVDAQGKNGVTPLHVASHYDHQNVALLLLDKGASPHATAKNGHTPLHIAAKKNQMDIATTLLEYGAQANAESKAGFTPLHLSAQEGHTDMSSLLIEHKADTNHHAKNGLTPLHLCAQEDRVDVAQLLAKNSAEVDSVTKAGYTPLHVASHFGQVNMVRFLLQNGADVKATTGIGYTPLHQAAQQGHANVVNMLLDNSAQPNVITNNGQTPLQIAQKLGYISVIETLKVVTNPSITPTVAEEKYRVVAPEAMHETFMSDSEEEGGEDTMLADQPYRYLTVDEMKSLGDDSLPIDVTRDERVDSNRMVTSGDANMLPPQAIEDSISPQHISQKYAEFTSNKYTLDNVDIGKHPVNVGFLVSFLVDARGGAMRGCRHSGVRVIVPSRCAPSPTRITCRYVKPQRTPHPPPLMEGEALASRVLELGPVGAKFLGPVILEVPHFAALRGKEREIVILRSDNGETWREHTVEASEDVVNDVLNDSFEAEDLNQLEDVASGRITRILTHDFPQYFAVVSRIRQEVHAIGPEGGMVSSTVVPQVQAVFPQGALTKKIKVGLQAQPIDPELAAKLLGHGVAVSPVVTVEPRRRKFHKAITLSMPAPRAHSQGMINQYSGSAPTLRLLCSITGGTTRAQWEDVTGSTPLTFVNDCVSFTTTVSARFWLMDCRNIGDATKMATELYREAIHVPFMAKFVVFAKRVDPLEARLRVFCMTDDKEDKTLEHQEHFTEVAKSRDVEVLEGKPQYIEFAGNLVPITKSGEQLQFAFRAFRENRLPFSVRVKDQHADTVGRCLFMREAKVAKGEPPQQPICILNIVLPDDIVTETISLTDTETLKRNDFFKDDFYQRTRLSDMSNLLGEDWVSLASELGLSTSEINVIKSEYPDSVAKQAQSMLRMWRAESGNKAQKDTLEQALRRIGRDDIIPQCLNVDALDHAVAKVTRDQGGFESLKEELGPSRDASLRRDISLDTAVYERDLMKDSESVESLMLAEKKDPLDDNKIQNFRESEESKYSAEEKIVTEEEEEAAVKKSVQERRQEIEKRLSEERKIPASAQRFEIVQEISTIKRQSLVEDKVKDGEFDEKPPTTEPIEIHPSKTTTTITKTTVTTTTNDKPLETKTKEVKIVEIVRTTELSELEQKLANQKMKIERTEEDKPQTGTTVTTTVIETRTNDISSDETTHRPDEPTAQDRRDSALFEGVTQELERLETKKKTGPMPKATEDLKSPKTSKTPPPSPADFIVREQTSNIQEWGTSKEQQGPSDHVDELGPSQEVKDAAQQGKTTSSPKTILNTDTKPIIEQTSSFITSESQPDSYQSLDSKILPDQDSVKSSDQKEQEKDKKEKKGFFSSLKSLVGKPFDHSDAQLKDEKSTKKESPKKGKKNETIKITVTSPKGTGKAKLPTPEMQRKVAESHDANPIITLNQDSIPDIDDMINDRVIQVTDLDAEPMVSEDIKREATNIVETVIHDGQNAASKILEQKSFEAKQQIQYEFVEPSTKEENVVKFNLDSSIVEELTDLNKVEQETKIKESVNYAEKNKEALRKPEENWKTLTNDMIQNEINFQGWNEKYGAPNDKIKIAGTKMNESFKEETEKTDTLKAKKSKGFFKIFGKKESRESDESDTQTDESKIVISSDSDKESEKKGDDKRRKKSGGLFGIFKKGKKEAEKEHGSKSQEKKNKEKDKKEHVAHEKADIEASEKSIKPAEFSKEVAQQMVDSAHFLLFETETYEDVRIIYPNIPETPSKPEDIEGKLNKNDDAKAFEHSKITEEKPSHSKTTDDYYPKSKDTKEKSKETKEDTKEKTRAKTKKQGGFFSKLGEKFGTSQVKDEITEAVTDTIDKNKEATKATVQRDSELISDNLAPLTNEKDKQVARQSNEVQEEEQKLNAIIINAVDHVDEKVENETSDINATLKKSKGKTGGFFSDLGQKISKTTNDNIDTFIYDKDQGVEKITETSSIIQETVLEHKEKAHEITTNLGEKTNIIVSDTKETIASARDQGAETVKDTINVAKGSVSKSIQKVDEFSTQLEEKIHTTANDMKDFITAGLYQGPERVNNTTIDIKDQITANGAVIDTKDKDAILFSDFEKKITDAANDTKKIIASVKDKDTKTIKDTDLDLKKSVKRTKEKSGGFFSSLKQKISDADSDAKDTFETVEKQSIAIVHDNDRDIRDTVQKSRDKVEVFGSGFGQILSDSVSSTKDTIISVKEQEADNMKDTTSNIEDAVQKSIDETEEFFSGLGQKISNTSDDTIGSIASSKEQGTDIVKDATNIVKETITESKVKVDESLSVVSQKTDATTSDMKDIIKSTKGQEIKTVKDIATNATSAIKDSKDKTEKCISGLGVKISEITSDTKDTIVDAKNQEIKKIKTTACDLSDAAQDKNVNVGNFFSEVGQKINETSGDVIDSITTAKDLGTDKVKTTASVVKEFVIESQEKTDEFFRGLEQPINMTASGTKETVIADHDSENEIVRHTISDIQDTVRETKQNSGEFITDIGQKISDTSSVTKDIIGSAKDRGTKKVKDTDNRLKETVTESKNKVGEFFSGLGGKVSDTKKSFFATKDQEVNKMKDTYSDLTDSVKDTTEKVDNVFSDLGKKISHSVTDSNDTITSAKNQGIDKVDDMIRDVKYIADESKSKADALFSGVDQKIGETASDTKDTIISAKYKINEIARDTIGDGKDCVEISIDKCEGFFTDVDKICNKSDDMIITPINEQETKLVEDTLSDNEEDKAGEYFSTLGDKISDTASDTKEIIISVKDQKTKKIKDVSSDLKDTARDTIGKADGFLSSLGQSLSRSLTDSKDTVICTKDQGAAKVDDTVKVIKSAVDDSKVRAKSLFSGLEQKIDDTATDTKDTIISAKYRGTDIVKDATTDVKDGTKMAINKTEKCITDVGQKISETSDNIIGTIDSVRDQGTEILKDPVSNIEETIMKPKYKVEGYFSGLGDKITDVVSDNNDTIISTKNQETNIIKDTSTDLQGVMTDTKGKAKGFFSNLGQVISRAVTDSKDTIISAKHQGTAQVDDRVKDVKSAIDDSKVRAKSLFSDLEHKIDDTAIDTKDTIISDKCQGTEVVKDATSNVKDGVKAAVDKSEGFVTGLGQKISEASDNTIDTIASVKVQGTEAVRDKATGIKEAVKDTKYNIGGFFSKLEEKIGDAASDTTQSVVSTKDKEIKKIKDTSSDLQDAAKDTKEKADGFFSDLGQKISHTIKGSRDTIISAKDQGINKVDDVAKDVKSVVGESKSTAEMLFSDLEQKIDHTATGTKDTIISGENQGIDNVKLATSDVVDDVKISSDKAEKFFSNIGQKLRETSDDTVEAITSAKNQETNKVKDAANNVKEAVKESKDNACRFFSDIEEQISDCVNDTKDNIILAKDQHTEDIQIITSDIKEAVVDKKENVDGFFSDLDKKISDITKDTKDTIISAKDHDTENMKVIANDSINTVQDKKEKLAGFVSGIGQKIGQTSKATVDTVTSAKDQGIDHVKETVSDVKESVKDSKDAGFGLLIDIGDSIRNTKSNTKDTIISERDQELETIIITHNNLSNSAQDEKEKTGGIIKDIKPKINDTVTNTRDKIASAKDLGIEKVQDTSRDIKDAVKESNEIVGGLFSDLGHKISERATDNKDTIVSGTDQRTKSVQKMSSNVIDTFKEAKDEAEGNGTGLEQKINERASNIKDIADSAKQIKKVERMASDVKIDIKKAKKKGVGLVTGSRQEISDIASDTKDNIVSAQVQGTEKAMSKTSDVKESVKKSKKKASGFISDIGKNICLTTNDTKDTIDATKEKESDKIKTTVSDVQDTVKQSKGVAGELVTSLKDVVKDTGENAVGFFSSLGQKISDITSDSDTTTKENVVFDKCQETDATINKLTGNVKDIIEESKEKAEKSIRSDKQKINNAARDTLNTIDIVKDHGTKKVKNIISDVKDDATDRKEKIACNFSTITEKASNTADAITDIVKDQSTKISKEISHDVQDIVNESKDTSGILLSSVHKKIGETISDIKDITFSVQDQRNERATDKSSFESNSKRHKSKQKDSKRKISEQNIDLSNLPIMTDALPKKVATKTKSDSVCYVTTPTMQRRGIGGSQRLAKEDRPSLIDISNMPADCSSSDEDDYIVTEPADDYDVRRRHLVSKSSDTVDLSSASTNGDDTSKPGSITIPKIYESEYHDESHDEFKANDSPPVHSNMSPDHKRRPLFHIESEEDDSFDLGGTRESRTENLKNFDEEKFQKTDLDESRLDDKGSNVKTEASAAQYDVELIEQKLLDLNKALDNLEKADNELHNEENALDDKKEHKLRRVERHFERMASETIEQENKEAKQKQDVTSPEIDATREAEFQKICSQLSREEVSDCQNVYSNLWDEVTFTPSEEWDSKTPDSQPDDIQELPQEPSGSWQETVSTTTARAVTGASAAQALREEEKKASNEMTEAADSSQEGPSRSDVADQQQLSSEMKELLEEMEKQAKH